MPAHPERRQVLTRMFPEQRERLDVLCIVATERQGAPVSRTEVINGLIRKEYDSLSSAARKRARSKLSNGSKKS